MRRAAAPLCTILVLCLLCQPITAQTAQATVETQVEALPTTATISDLTRAIVAIMGSNLDPAGKERVTSLLATTVSQMHKQVLDAEALRHEKDLERQSEKGARWYDVVLRVVAIGGSVAAVVFSTTR